MGFFDLFRRKTSSLVEKQDEKGMTEKQKPNQDALSKDQTYLSNKLTNIDNKLDSIIDIMSTNAAETKSIRTQNMGETKNPAIDKILNNLVYLNSRLDKILTKESNEPNTNLTDEMAENSEMIDSEFKSEALIKSENENLEVERLTLGLKEVLEVIKEKKSVTPSELADQLRIKRRSAYEMLQKLVAMKMVVDHEGRYSLKPQIPAIASAIAVVSVVYFLAFVFRVKNSSPTSQAILVSNMNPNFLLAGIFSMIIAAVFIFATTVRKS